MILTTQPSFSILQNSSCIPLDNLSSPTHRLVIHVELALSCLTADSKREHVTQAWPLGTSHPLAALFGLRLDL